MSPGALWDVFAGAGGALGAFCILLLAAGIAALTVVFLGSAVVVLERFARTARRVRSVALSGLVLSLGAAAIALHVAAPELETGPWSEWAESFLLAAGGCVVVTAVCVLVCWALLRALPRRVLGALALALLALALGLAWLLPPPSELAAVEGGLTPRSLPGGALLGLLVFGLLPLSAGGFLDMRRSAEWFIAVRYLVARRRQVFISAITMICIAGIAAGVWLIVVVLSVMNGFETTWRDEIVGNRAHFTVHNGFGPFDHYREVLERVRSVPGVVAASPYLDAEGMVRGEDGQIYAVRVRGIDPESVSRVTDLREDLIVGSLDALGPVHPDGDGSEAADGTEPGIVVGNQLATSLGVRLGDPLLLISPYGGPPTPLGPAPRLKRFRVVGVFESSFFQYDEVYTYVSLSAAQDFRRSGDVVDGIEARTSDFYRSRRVAGLVELQLDYPFFTRDWKEFFPAFFQALKTERVMMFILLTMIMVVAAFIIVATLIMMIMEKSSDIAILKAMGADEAGIERIFAIEGTLIGLAGTALGMLAGIAVTHRLAWIQKQVEGITGIDTLPASIYQFSTLPSEVDPVQILIVAAIAMVLSLGATLLPSRQGARLDPAEALRYE